MEFKHLEYFVETSRYKSMSKAAEALYISQQALSRCIANMERELGVELFSRSVKGIKLTEDGKYLYDTFAPQVERFHETLDEATAHFDSLPQGGEILCPQIPL